MPIRDQLARSAEAPAGSVTLAEYGNTTVYLRRWSLAQVQEMRAATAGESQGPERLADLLVLSACEADGTPAFDRASALLVPFAAAELIVGKALDANGLNKEAAERGKGNSPPTTK